MPKPFAVTTWNINSVRLRLGLVQRLVADQNPDVICLQEIKCEDHCFPLEAIADMGYVHQHVHGMKSYNGVAILSKLPLADKQIFHRTGKEDRRHISARLANGIELHNLYVPAGGDIPDPDVNDKFRHKLDFIDELTAWSASLKRDVPRILVGDFNIAPGEHDVWSSKALTKVVSHTPIEIEKLRGWQQAGDWVDSARHFIPADQKIYSWWSYRSPNWQTRDLGRRLDHIWVSPDLQNKLASMVHFRDARAWEQPSDHIPVTLRLSM